jgi:tetratricopeptide (TPR) repeat protein
MDRAWEMISRGEGVQALLAARQALQIDADSPEAHNLLGCIYAMDGDFSEALTCYQRAIELDDGYLDPLLNKAELLLHARTSSDEAIQLCIQARSLVAVEEELVEVVLLEVDALLNLGKLDEAHLKLMEIEPADTMSPYHSMMLGRAFYETGDFERAEGFIDRAIAGDDSLTDAWYCRGLLQREAGQRIDAVVSFTKVLKADAKKAPLPWIAELDEPTVETLIRAALQRIPEHIKEMLAQTDIKIVPLPSADQLRREIDPRQALWAEGINLKTGSFERLWVFVNNLEFAGISPDHKEEGLAALVEDEVCPTRP